jgi:hypothetical protein
MWQQASNRSWCINQISQVRKSFETLSCTTFLYKMEKKFQWNFIRANVDLFFFGKIAARAFLLLIGLFFVEFIAFFCYHAM